VKPLCDAEKSAIRRMADIVRSKENGEIDEATALRLIGEIVAEDDRRIAESKIPASRA
jgi:hypothetical protein